MLMLIDSVRCGLRNLGRKRFRSVLTILGISIGGKLAAPRSTWRLKRWGSALS